MLKNTVSWKAFSSPRGSSLESSSLSTLNKFSPKWSLSSVSSFAPSRKQSINKRELHTRNSWGLSSPFSSFQSLFSTKSTNFKWQPQEQKTFRSFSTFLSGFSQQQTFWKTNIFSTNSIVNALLLPKRNFAEAPKTEAPSLQDLEKSTEEKRLPHPKKGRRRARQLDEAWAIIRNIRVSQKKLNYVCKVIRGLSYEEAIRQLKFSPKKIGRSVVLRAVQSARYNAENNHGLDPTRCIVSEAFVGRGTILKRVRYRGKGGMGLMYHRFSHLTIILKEIPVPKDGVEKRLGKFGRKNPDYQASLEKSLNPPSEAPAPVTTEAKQS